jgi:hypothetical protein
VFEPRQPMTLGDAAAARVQLIVWCKKSQHQVEPPALQGEDVRFVPDSPVEEDGFELVSHFQRGQRFGPPFGFPVDGTVLRAF